MTYEPPAYSIEALYREFQPTLVAYAKWKFPNYRDDAEDIVQNVFIQLQKRGTRILGEVTLASLQRHTWQRGVDFVRNQIVQGRAVATSLDFVLESLGYQAEAKNEGYSTVVEALEIAEKVVAETHEILGDREKIVLRVIRENLPRELGSEEMLGKLTASERLRLLPVRRPATVEEADKLILSQLSRTKSSLISKLRKTRRAMEM